MRMTKFQQQLMAAAKEDLRSSLALHANCRIIIDEQLAKDAIDKHKIFCALVERAVDAEVLAELGIMSYGYAEIRKNEP